MSIPLTDRRVVIVTGGASGIGWACSQRFAAAGDHVVILDRTGAEAAAARLGQDHIGQTVDVADEPALVAAIATVAACFGRIDVLVNNAGVIDAVATPAIDIAPADFERLLAINLEGAFVAAREAGRVMLDQRRGAIVNIASLAGVVAIPGRTGYSLTKAAMLGWTRALACEWAAQGVRVNAVMPGYVETDIVASLKANGRIDMRRVEARIPLARLASPAEIAAVIAFVASDDASYITGTAVAVDGGYEAFGGTADASAGGGRVRPHPAEQRVALVTGAGSGIGAAVAVRLATDGDRLVLFDRDADGLAQTLVGLPGDHLCITGDVRSAVDIAAAVAAAGSRLALVVNNAGIADNFVPTTAQTLADFRRVIAIDLTGALMVARAAAPVMMAENGGSIVNIASIAGLIGLPRRNAYSAAKAGVIMLTRSLACEWAAGGIRVNAVAPGYVGTPGMLALERGGHRNLQHLRRRTPMQRLGMPGEIAATVAFLGSPDASYMTGTTLVADGGWTAFGDTGPE